MTNPHCYEIFNTTVDVSESIGVTWQHKSLLEYLGEESHPLGFYSCTEDQQESVSTNSEEIYLSYAILSKSGNQNINLKVDLQNDLATGNNQYPMYCSRTIHLLDKFIKKSAPKMPASKVLLFSHEYFNKGNGGRGGRNKRGRDDKIKTRSNARKINYTSVVKNYIRCIIAKTLETINTMMTRAQEAPVLEQA